MPKPILVSDILELFDGNKTEAAEQMEVSRRTLSSLSDDAVAPAWIVSAARTYLLKTDGALAAKWMPK